MTNTGFLTGMEPSEPDIFVIGSQDFIFSSLGVQVGVCRKRCRVVLKFGISPFFIEISDDSHPAGRYCRLVFWSYPTTFVKILKS